MRNLKLRWFDPISCFLGNTPNYVARVNVSLCVYFPGLMIQREAMNYTFKGDNNSAAYENIIIVINCVLNAPLMLISIVGNSLVLVAVFTTTSIRSPSMTMLCSLAVSDLLVGFIAQPLYIADELTTLRAQDVLLYRLSAMIGFFVCGVSLGTITAITVDRYMALHYHMRYAALVTEARVRFTIAIIWVTMLLSLGFYVWDKFIFHLMSGIFSCICLGVCAFFYVRIYRIVFQHQSQIYTQQLAVEGSDDADRMRMARLKKSALNTFLFYICMVVCYFPHFVLMTLFATIYKDWKTEWTFATTIVFMNSSLNPVLYCWRLRELKVAVIKITKRLLANQLVTES